MRFRGGVFGGVAGIMGCLGHKGIFWGESGVWWAKKKCLGRTDVFGGEKGCWGIMWCLRRKWGALTCLGIKLVFGGRKECRRHNGVFGVQMRCFGHGDERGSWWAKRGA